MTDDDKKTLIDAYVAAYNGFDIEGMLTTLSDDVRFEHHVGDQLAVATHGKADFEKLARVGAQLFAAREQQVVSLEDREGAIVATIDFHGEIAEDIPDGPRGGTVIEMQGTSEFGFADGKIAWVVDRG